MNENSGVPEPGRAPAESAIRIGDTERNAAVDALGEHLSTGRLDLDEFGTRSAVAGNARTVGELAALFADLPAPHPPLPSVASPVELAGAPQAISVVGASAAYSPVVDNRTRAQKFVAAAASGSVIIALVLFFATGEWWWWLLIPLISTVAGSVWGDSWKRPDRRD